MNEVKQILSDNFYWLPDATGNYSGLQEMKKAIVDVKAVSKNKEQITVTIHNPANNTVAFFNRISLVNAQTKERLLPTFYSDNYISILPGEEKSIVVESRMTTGNVIEVSGWNVETVYIEVK